MSAETVIEAVGLTKIFLDFWRRPRVRALDGFSFEVRRGEVFGLLGPNGSGKSTTLKLLLGLLRPTSGRLIVLGRPPTDVRIKSRIGYLPEESYLYPFLTAEETLDFFGRLFDLPTAERRRRIEQLLEMTGLTAARRRRVGEFSKGMARRVGLAQALINDPDLVILDEPTSGLDPIGCRQMKELIRTLAGRGKTVVLSSHLLADVEDVADRVAILYGGRLQAMGAISELLEERERCRLTLTRPPPGTLERLCAVARELTGTEPEVDHPRMDLEEYFLAVVRRAREGTGDETAPGGTPQVASYLAGEAGRDAVVSQASTTADERLRHLVKPPSS
ncbi:MAG: ABC transporter ATP-binding protein [Kiritimatiellae bacterium]|nr:ABC transporter ATP-binding protein [Kiritimatiellia bacterium]